MKLPKIKRVKQKKRRKFRFTNLILYTLLTIFILGVVGMATVYYIVKSIIAETPPIEEYDINQLLAENSEIYAADGTLLEKVSNGNIRTIIPYDEIDEDIIKAFVAVEDKTFFEHKGFNFVRLVGAAIEGVLNRKTPAGTSTITQQYARNMYLTDTRFERKGKDAYVRKIREMYYTVEIEKHLDKKQILSAYLNTIELGANVKGIEAACQRYFSKSANDINYIEAAILAGIPQANTAYSPFAFKKNEDVTSNDYVLGDHGEEYTIVFNEKCLKRYNIVLAVMKNLNVITEDEYKIAKDYDIKTLLKPGILREDISSYFTDMVKEEVIEKLQRSKALTHEEARQLLYNGGLRIYSTLDIKLQKQLEASYNAEEFTNYFDETTRLAAVAFQKKYGLGVDGVIGPKTIAKFAELNLLDPSQITLKSFYKGLANDEVLLIKQALERTGLLYKRNDNLPSIRAYRDANRNILNVTDVGRGLQNFGILLLYHNNLVDGEDNLVINADEFEKLSNGDIILKKNQSLKFYSVKNEDGTNRIDVFIKDSYKSDPDFETKISGGTNLYHERIALDEFYIFKGKSVAIPNEYKALDDDGNLIIDHKFFENTPDFYKIANGNLLIAKKYYNISTNGIIQPQSAMVITDYHNGHLKAVMGGRNVSGQLIFNRAINPRPPGSSVKPLAVYLPALDNGYTAATVIDDIPKYTENGKRWPLNWYEHMDFAYRGRQTLREAVEDSENIIPVKVLEKIGVDKSIEYMKKLGISTIVETGPSNDLNTAAMALGGMTQGLTPFESAEAYGAIANGGIRNETVTFTKITDKNGNILLENVPEKTFVVSEPIAFIMHDILRTTVTRGLAAPAKVRDDNVSIPTAGKTGTTSKNIDAWFVGYTPYYVASMWVGNDLQIPLSTGSNNTAKYWGKIMKSVHASLPDKSFKTPSEAGVLSVSVDKVSGLLPSALSQRDPLGSQIVTELFAPDTQPTEVDNAHIELDICTDSGKIATPFCPKNKLQKKVFRLRLDDDYDPYFGRGDQNPIVIKDDEYTIPKMYLKGFVAGSEEGQQLMPELREDLDFKKLAKYPRSAICNLHIDASSQSTNTLNLFSNVKIQDIDEMNKIFVQEIIITTIHDTRIVIPYGSRINADGIIVTSTGENIYPWQIKSYQLEEGGEVFIVPQADTSTTPSPSEGNDVESESSTGQDDVNEAPEGY